MTRKKIRFYVLALYDLFLAVGAIVLGIAMIHWGNYEYPKEWLDILPFTSWVVPGIMAICFYGLGNLLVAVFSILNWEKRSNRNSTGSNATMKGPWLGSTIMGGIFFISLIAQVIILNEIFLATAQFFVLSIIQLLLSLIVFLGCRRDNLRIVDATVDPARFEL